MSYSPPHMLFGLALMAAGAILFVEQGCQRNEPATQHVVQTGINRQSSRQPAENRPESPHAMPWKSLFDGQTLAGWKTPA